MSHSTPHSAATSRTPRSLFPSARLFPMVALALFIGCNDTATETDTETTHEVDEVTVRDEWRTCSVAEDCRAVESLCSQCCEYHAVNEASVAQYQAHYSESCEGYVGGVCDCEPHRTEVDCVNDACVVTVVVDDAR